MASVPPSIFTLESAMLGGGSAARLPYDGGGGVTGEPAAASSQFDCPFALVSSRMSGLRSTS